MGLSGVVLGRPVGPDLGRRWKVWDLDSELRYRPVVDALPASGLAICEVGSGPQGLAAWTSRPVIGVDPGADDPHGERSVPPNMTRMAGDGAHIPLGDASVCAAVAVDTFEHIPATERAAVVDEMVRVVVPGGRVVIIGPSGAAAADGDRMVLNRWRERGDNGTTVHWLSEHEQIGLPDAGDLTSLLKATGRVGDVAVSGVFNIALWKVMHRVTLEDYPNPRGSHHVHHVLWAPFAAVARRTKRGPHYRAMLVAEVR
jgi:SAM-dependent methyltransferase